MPRRPGPTARSSSRSSKRAEGAAGAPPETRAGWLAVGEVVAAHGLHGLLRVRAYQPPAPSLAPDRLIRLEQAAAGREARIASAAPHGRGLVLVALTGVGDRAAAEALVGSRVLVRTADLPPAADDEFYYYEVVGFRVETAGGEQLGTLVATLATGANDAPRRILLSPQGAAFSHERARGLASERSLLLLCARYEGLDERVKRHVDEELSIGDYVLSGGELAALVVLDAVARLLPGVLGNVASPADDSFATGLLEHPQYTRPEEFRGVRVPDVLLSGEHAAIARWRREQSLRLTLERRPDLLARAPLDATDRAFLRTLGWEQGDE